MYWQTKWVLQDLRDVWIESGSSEAICLRFSSDPGYSGRAAGGAVLQRSKQLLLYPLSKNSPWNIRACRFSDLSRQMGVSGVTHSSRWVWLKRLIGVLVWLFSCDTLPSVKTPMHRQLDTLVPAAGFRDNISSDAGKASAAMKLLLLNISHEFLR